nr:cytochrome P450 [Baekduia soli]
MNVTASPAGPITAEEAGSLPEPPAIALPRFLQVLRFNQRQIEFVFGARRRHGDVFRMRGTVPGGPVITCHPDHVQSLFTAKPELAPSLTGESPLRPIVGPNSVLTSIGPRHLRQRKLLLPPFHGEAIARYQQLITDAADREIDTWPLGRPIALAPRMQAITLDVIMAGIFGIEGRPERGSAEHRLRAATKGLLAASTWKIAQLAEIMNIGRDEPIGLTRSGLAVLDRATYAVISERRAISDLDDRNDILSMLLRARTDDGEALSDRELRDELLTLVLAGHETTANSLAWTWERLVRTPAAHDALRDAVRSDDAEASARQVEATIHEGMRVRPVIPIIGRRVQVPWRLGEYAVGPDTPVTMSILLLHHREDVYPEPFAFRPERWHDRKPGTYTWIPFGGGIRRCLGAALAMAEQRVVLETMARRLDLAADDPAPERAVHRNVTMIPARGAMVVVRSRLGRAAGRPPSPRPWPPDRGVGRHCLIAAGRACSSAADAGSAAPRAARRARPPAAGRRGAGPGSAAPVPAPSPTCARRSGRWPRAGRARPRRPSRRAAARPPGRGPRACAPPRAAGGARDGRPARRGARSSARP